LDKEKKIIILSTYDHGGAGTAAYNLMEVCCELGYKTALIVKHKVKSDKNVFQVKDSSNSIASRLIGKLNFKDRYQKERKEFIKNTSNKEYYFFQSDESYSETNIQFIIDAFPFSPNILLSGWTSDFINFKQLAEISNITSARTYAIMYDMAPLTGGCHYSWDCLGYQEDCYPCPALTLNKFKTQAKKNLITKSKFVREGNINCIVASKWSLQQAVKSSLFKNQSFYPILRGYINDSIYNIDSRTVAKKAFGINENKKTILIGAIDLYEKRKGYKLFVEALKELETLVPLKDEILILIVGNSSSVELPFNYKLIPYIKDEHLLSLLYQASDVYANTTIEDTGPQMILQAMACGATVVSFNVGFGHDISDEINGFRCKTGNTKDFSDGLFKAIFNEPDVLNIIKDNARTYVKEHCSAEAISKFIDSL
jgi:glycosyltransferase involved in cell wall biosynthesis